MGIESSEHEDATHTAAEDGPPTDQLHGGFDDPEELDVDELENDDGWAEEDDA